MCGLEPLQEKAVQVSMLSEARRAKLSPSLVKSLPSSACRTPHPTLIEHVNMSLNHWACNLPRLWHSGMDFIRMALLVRTPALTRMPNT